MEIPYASFELVEAKDVKEGKQGYKRTEKVLQDMPLEDFIEKFVSDFDDFAKHVVESWFLNTVKNVAFSPSNQPSHAIVAVSDFAQNLQVEKKIEMSEEHFHKAQIAMFATVVSVSTPEENGGNIKHSITQVTTSNNKSVLQLLKVCYLLIHHYRTKDSAWVYGSLQNTVPESLEFARDLGHSIKLYVEKVYFLLISIS